MKVSRKFLNLILIFAGLQAAWFLIIWAGFCIGCGGFFFDSGILLAVTMFDGITQCMVFFLFLYMASAILGEPFSTTSEIDMGGYGYYAYHNPDGTLRDQPDFNNTWNWLDD